MERGDVTELHYITPIANVPSILQRGLLSHHRANKLPHQSVASLEIQEKRAQKRVPGGKALHDYVNLYFHARNPMLYSMKEMRQTLCVLRVSVEVLDWPDVVITDGNAASDYTAFYPSPDGLRYLNRNDIFAEWWKDENEIKEWEKKRVKCAAVLVLERIVPNYILGAYVCSEQSEAELVKMGFNLPIVVDPYLFFL